MNQTIEPAGQSAAFHGLWLDSSQWRRAPLLAHKLGLAVWGIFCSLAAAPVGANDWNMWGRDPTRNMASPASGLASTFDAGEFLPGSERIDPESTRGVRWVVKLGSQTYGNPVVAERKVFVGTNNESPRDPEIKGDRGILMCFTEKSGEFLWQLVVPKLGAGKVSDWEYVGLCSSPAVIDGRVYVVTNRGEVVCLDIEGLRDGNDGPFLQEGAYMAGPGKAPIKTTDRHADIIWVFDMRDELGVFPHNVSSSSPLVVDGRVYVTTSNGVDWSHINIPAPFAPTFIALDAETGVLIGEEISGVSARALHAGWSSPAYGEADGNGLIIWGGSDGWAYGYDPVPVDGEDGFPILRELWRFDCNPHEYRYREGKKIRYATRDGPSEVIGSPVAYKGRAYVTVGQDPEHGDGVGRLSCIDLRGRGDISKNGALWTYREIGRSISTVSIADDLVYVAEYAGKIHCLDADSGTVHWVHDTLSRIWGSTLVADGKVYLGNEDGDIVILRAGKEKKVLAMVNLHAPVYSSPIEANGIVYIASQTHLYAIGEGHQK